MALTAEQRETRKKHIGSSDVAAILGLSPWRSACDVWLEKTGRLVDEKDPNAAMVVGTRVEPVLLDWLQEEIGRPVLRDTQFTHANGIMLASLDGLIECGDYDEHAEAKVTSILGGWGEEGTDQIPECYLVQIAHQFACLPESRLCHVPILKVNHGASFARYAVTREQATDLIAVVEEEACNFWHRFVLTDTMPEQFTPSIDVSKRIRKQPGKTVSIPAGPVEMYLSAKRGLAEAKQAAENAEAVIRTYMDGADEADTPLGKFTLKTSSRKAYTAAACEFTQLRFVEPKKK